MTKQPITAEQAEQIQKQVDAAITTADAASDSTFASGLGLLAMLALGGACLYGWALNGTALSAAYYDKSGAEVFWRFFGQCIPPIGALMGFFW